MTHAPAPKGSRLQPIRKIQVAPWDEEGNFVISVKVNKTPKISASRKCYLFAMEQGETDITVNIDGKDRKVRMTFMLYVKIPANERRASFQEDARRSELAGEPKLY